MRRGMAGSCRQGGGRQRRRGDVCRRARAEDDVDGTAAALAWRSRHRCADRDVGEVIAVDVVPDDAVPEHLARVAADRERGVGQVDRRGSGGQRATVPEEDVDDAGVGAAADIGRRQAHGIVAEAVAVDVAELGDRGEGAVPGRHAELRQRIRRQRAAADGAREHAEADDRDGQREQRAGPPQQGPPHAVGLCSPRASVNATGIAGVRAC